MLPPQQGEPVLRKFVYSSFQVTKSLQRPEHLLVSSFEVTSVMATSFKQQSHVNITLHHSVTCVHFFSGWLPFQRGLLHNWTIGRKVHSIKSNFMVKAVFFFFQQSDEKKVRHSQCRQAKIREETLFNIVGKII